MSEEKIMTNENHNPSLSDKLRNIAMDEHEDGWKYEVLHESAKVIEEITKSEESNLEEMPDEQPCENKLSITQEKTMNETKSKQTDAVTAAANHILRGENDTLKEELRHSQANLSLARENIGAAKRLIDMQNKVIERIQVEEGRLRECVILVRQWTDADLSSKLVVSQEMLRERLRQCNIALGQEAIDER